MTVADNLTPTPDDINTLLVQAVNARDIGMLEGIEVVETSAQGLLAERPSGARLAEWESMSEVTEGAGSWMAPESPGAAPSPTGLAGPAALGDGLGQDGR